jgi:hypothetical protein
MRGVDGVMEGTSALIRAQDFGESAPGLEHGMDGSMRGVDGQRRVPAQVLHSPPSAFRVSSNSVDQPHDWHGGARMSVAFHTAEDVWHAPSPLSHTLRSSSSSAPCSLVLLSERPLARSNMLPSEPPATSPASSASTVPLTLRNKGQRVRLVTHHIIRTIAPSHNPPLGPEAKHPGVQ